MSTKQERIIWVDNAKYICIMLVMLTHLETATLALQNFLEPFFLTGFLFAAGYTFSSRYRFPDLMKKKVIQLFIPWLLWGLLAILFHQLFPAFRSSTYAMGAGRELFWFLLQIREINDGPWFLAMLFISFVPFYLIVQKYEDLKRKKVRQAEAIIFAMLLILYFAAEIYCRKMPAFFYGNNKLIWHMEYLPTAMLFMFAGYCFRNRTDNMQNIAKPGASKLIICVLIYCILVLLIPGMSQVRLLQPYEYVVAGPAESGPLPITAAYASYHLLCQIVGIIFLVLVSMVLKANPYILYVGRNSLTFFPMHVYVFVLFQKVFKLVFSAVYAVILSNQLSSGIFALTFTVVLSLILIVPSMIINRYFPFMAGKGFYRG